MKLAPTLVSLSLGLVTLSMPSQPAHAQTTQASQKPVLTTLHRFDKTQGCYPYFTLMTGKDGDFYGVTEFGGLNSSADLGRGVIFKMTPEGQYRTLWRFDGANGSLPYGSLVAASDGSFWGTTAAGGIGYTANNIYNGSGTIFRITPEGTLTTIFRFRSEGQSTNKSGIGPVGLMLSSDGNFYGATRIGGFYGYGTVFCITPSGVFSIIHDFKQQDGTQTSVALTQGPNGALYGVSSSGGKYGAGTIYRVRPGIDFHVLRSFTRNDGVYPQAPLVVGSNGALYGVTLLDSDYDAGSAFRLSSSGVFSTLHRFYHNQHDYAPSSLLFGPDGLLYGTLSNDSDGATGTVFSMDTNGVVTSLYQFHPVPGGTFPNLSFPHGFCPSSVVFGVDGALYGTTEYGGRGTGYGGYGTIFKLTLPQ